jgi:flagellin-specific chaperone FliS
MIPVVVIHLLNLHVIHHHFQKDSLIPENQVKKVNQEIKKEIKIISELIIS